MEQTKMDKDIEERRIEIAKNSEKNSVFFETYVLKDRKYDGKCASCSDDVKKYSVKDVKENKCSIIEEPNFCIECLTKKLKEDKIELIVEDIEKMKVELDYNLIKDIGGMVATSTELKETLNEEDIPYKREEQREKIIKQFLEMVILAISNKNARGKNE